jgi:hypothetical protein
MGSQKHSVSTLPEDSEKTLADSLEGILRSYEHRRKQEKRSHLNRLKQKSQRMARDAFSPSLQQRKDIAIADFSHPGWWDWEYYVPVEVSSAWHRLTERERIIAYFVAIHACSCVS